MCVDSRLKVTKIIGQRKAFYTQRIQEYSYAKKETVGIDIIVISRNDDRKIIQSITMTSRPSSRIRKWSQVSQFKRTTTNVLPIEKTCAGYISMMSQGFMRGSK